MQGSKNIAAPCYDYDSRGMPSRKGREQKHMRMHVQIAHLLMDLEENKRTIAHWLAECQDIRKRLDKACAEEARKQRAYWTACERKRIMARALSDAIEKGNISGFELLDLDNDVVECNIDIMKTQELFDEARGYRRTVESELKDMLLEKPHDNSAVLQGRIDALKKRLPQPKKPKAKEPGHYKLLYGGK